MYLNNQGELIIFIVLYRNIYIQIHTLMTCINVYSDHIITGITYRHSLGDRPISEMPSKCDVLKY